MTRGVRASLPRPARPSSIFLPASLKLATLDGQCRRQQLGEGWFSSLEEVPLRAISMSVRQILKARAILCMVPEARKAPAVRATLEGPVTPMVPASILKEHPNTTLYLDK